MEIREASEVDLESLVELNQQVQHLHIELASDLYRATGRSAVSDWFKDQLRDKATFVLIAESEGQVVGYVLVRLISRPPHIFCHDRSCAYLDQICVDTSHRRSGVGRELVDEAIQRTRQSGMTKLELDVRSDNKDARSSFEAMGFITYSEKMAMNLAGNRKP